MRPRLDRPCPPALPLVALALLVAQGLGSAPALAAQPARVLSPPHAGNAMDPQWSADGKTVAYEVSYSQQKYTEIFLLQRDGAEQKLMPSAGATGLSSRFANRKQVDHEFAWSPSGQLYAFASSGSDDDFDIYLRGVSVAIGGDHKEGGVGFSADGRKLSYCSAGTGDGDLYMLDIYTLEKPPTRLTFAPGLDFYAAWAPRGSALAYVSHSERGANIRVIDDTSAAKPGSRAVTNWSSNQLKPSWSPDGSWLAFYSNHGRDDRARFDLYVVQSAGGAPFVVGRDVLPSERRGPTWSPDSKELIVVQNDPNAGDPLVRISLESRNQQVIPTGTVNNGEPSVVADEVSGTWRLAFVSQGLRGADDNAWRRVWVYDLPREAHP